MLRYSVAVPQDVGYGFYKTYGQNEEITTDSEHNTTDDDFHDELTAEELDDLWAYLVAAGYPRTKATLMLSLLR